MPDRTLSRRDVTVLKGIGILLIFLHNYLHWEPQMGIENEFRFERSHFIHFLHHAFAGPLDLFRYGFAYFGHFGVQLFVLTSGYGLFLSAQAKGNMKFSVGYLMPKLIKIFSLLVVGTACILAVQYLRGGPTMGYKNFIMIIFGRMTSWWNFSYDTIFNFSGPFWFFGLIIQLYVIFPFLGQAVNRWPLRTNLIFWTVTLLVPMALFPVSLAHNVPLMALFIGQLPVFLMGILLAKYGYRPNIGLVSASLLLFALGQYYPLFYTTTFASIAYLMIAAYFALKRVRLPGRATVGNVLEKLGAISMTVFVLNGPLRSLPLFRNAAGDLLTERILIFIPILIAVSIPLAFLYRKLNALLVMLYGKAMALTARPSAAAS